MNIQGKNIKISIFGQSHSPAIGVTIDRLPSGIRVDFDELHRFLSRRIPGQGSHTTKRREPDEPEFLSGLVDGVTCGAAVTAIIRNTDTRSSDYDKIRDIPRPSHADYTAFVKHGESRDFRGGGEFSGRLTAPLCIAGGICLQLLRQKGIEIAAHISKIGGVQDRLFDPVNPTEEIRGLKSVESGDLPVLDRGAGVEMLSVIEAARKDGDSTGGIVECAAIGLPAGLGEPMFDGIENRLASVIFGIPAVKGVEFGNGFACADLHGSQNNDDFIMEGGKIKTVTNRHGGILGGITSGMPLILRAAFKPTPSISKEQGSVSLSKNENVRFVVEGRHGPCIVPRAVPCVEAAVGLVISDFLMSDI